MKKALSVLLIAAALFGFYGGAVNLNDVLACKDYWEEKGEQTTADMNKLEDGLNQLKDNEQAYLDGQVELADGEKALAEGEAAYADGQAELAKGEADYAAAPGKLAAARKQIAKGEKDLAAGEKDLADGKKQYAAGKKDYAAAPGKLAAGEKLLKGLDALIDGIDQVLDGYEEWTQKYDQLKAGREKLYGALKNYKGKLGKLAAFLPNESTQKAYLAALEDVAGDDSKQSASDYDDFRNNTGSLQQILEGAVPALKQKSADLGNLHDGLDNVSSSNLKFAGGVKNYKTNLLAAAALIDDETQKAQYEGAVNAAAAAYDSAEKTIADTVTEKVKEYMQGEGAEKVKAGVTEYMQSDEAKAAIAKYMQEEGLSQEEAQQKVLEQAQGTVQQKVIDAATAEIKPQVIAGVEADLNKNEQLSAAKEGILSALTDMKKTIDESVTLLTTQLIPGLKQFNAQVPEECGTALAEGQDKLAGGVTKVCAGAMSSDDLKKSIKQKMGSDAITLLSTYSNDPNPLNSSIATEFPKFAAQMDKTPGLVSAFQKAQALLKEARRAGQKTLDEGKSAYKAAGAKLASAEKQIAQGEKDLAAGKKKLADGKKQYAQGLADFAAAPAKLADGRAKLADAEQQLADGRQSIADGKAQLAEYEDGEQQVREGLATLMSTKPDGGLTSILERRNDDDDFDNGDTHLELDEGLEAVEVGRGYQADSGVLITKEITNRAIGTAAGLGAGALAIIAAILSFLKKNKASGILSILTAAAGGAAVAIGTAAGTEFSSIAGSLVGATPWIACGVLGGVALVHAITHLASKAVQ